MSQSNTFSTYNESPLHAAIKSYIAQPGDRFETEVDGYVIDVQRDDMLIEVQTRLFSAIKSKLYNLTLNHRVHLVFPIAVERWIVKPPSAEGGLEHMSRRRSPKRGKPLDIFSELVSIPTLIINPNFTIEVLYTHEEEIRHWVGRKAWRRKGWAIHHRRLLDVVDRQEYHTIMDFAALIPDDLPISFTTSDLAGTCGCRMRLAQQLAFCLREMGVIQQIGKRGRGYLYQMAEDINMD